MKILITLFTFIFSSIAYAEDWAYNFNLSKSLYYDDNVTMRQDPQGSFAYELIPNLTVLYQTEIFELQADASYGYQEYTDIDGFDFSLQQYGLKGTYFTENSQFGLSASYSLLPTIRTAEEDSGEFNLTSDKETKRIAPFISYNLTESDILGIEAVYLENSFSENDFGDNKQKQIDLTWQHIWTQQYTSSISLFYSRFEFMDGRSNAARNTIAKTENKTTSNNYGINFASTYRFSDRWTIQGEIGARITETTEILINNQQIKRTNAGFLTNTSINYTGEKFLASLAFTRALIPSNRGQLDEQNKLAFNIDYLITEQLSTSFLAGYQTSEKESNNNGNDATKRENIFFKPSINWEMSQNLILSASYRYRFQDESNKDHSVDSNLFMLSISYDWPGQIEK